ncbi:MAG: A24 family peptidase [Gammaproteobacteria bacterium]|jgi:leader peptidase (prepilin peptidase)/N-methyltransferase
MELLRLLEGSPALFGFISGLLGLLIGSFLNVVIYRLPVMINRAWARECKELQGEPEQDTAALATYNLVIPASSCPHCQRPIRALENIPVVSYLMLRGRCAGCGTAIPRRYPVVELVTALLSAIVAVRYGFGIEALAALLFTWALIPLFMIDFDHQILPDAITLPLLWAGLLLSLPGVFVDSTASIIGAAAGYLSLWSIYHLFRLLTGKEGMGYGDFKLLGAIGAWVGWQQLPVVILFSSVVGATIGIGLILFKGRDHSQPMPFGPFLAAAGWLTLLWGQDIIGLYLR